MKIKDIKEGGTYRIESRSEILIREYVKGQLLLVNKILEAGTVVKVSSITDGTHGTCRVVEFRIHTNGYFHQKIYTYPLGLFSYIIEEILENKK